MRRLFSARLFPSHPLSLPSPSPSPSPLLLPSSPLLLSLTRFSSTSSFADLLFAHHDVSTPNKNIWKEYHDADYQACQGMMGELMKLAPDGQADSNALKSIQNLVETFTQSPTPEVIECLQDVFHVYADPETTLLHEEGLRALLIEKEKCWDPQNNISKASTDVTKTLMLKNITNKAKENFPDLPEANLQFLTDTLSQAWDESYEECLPEVDKARNAYFTRAFDRGEDLHPYDLLLRLGAKEGEEEGEKKRGELGVSVNDFVEHFRKVYVVDVSNKLLSAPEYKGLTSFVEKRMEEKMTKLFG